VGTALQPNLTDFLTFLRGVVGIEAAYLPDASLSIVYAFQTAMATVSPDLAAIPSYPLIPQSPLPWTTYAIAVYNLAADRIISFAPDQTGRTYFVDMRRDLGINTFRAGVVASSGGTGNSQSTLNPEFMKGLTMGDLQNMKTPYGREYLNIAQQIGPLWGVT
jgi:hypothetical protein